VGLANAAPIVDQSNTLGGGVVYPAIEDTGLYSQTAQQTFTVGLTGELARIDLALGKRSEFGDVGTGTLAIKTLADVVLASLSFNVASLEEEAAEETPNRFTAFDLSAFDIFASAGEVLKIVLSHDSPGWLTWDTSATRDGINDYAGGAATVFAFVSGDAAFLSIISRLSFCHVCRGLRAIPRRGRYRWLLSWPRTVPRARAIHLRADARGLGRAGDCSATRDRYVTTALMLRAAGRCTCGHRSHSGRHAIAKRSRA
jgi:hypothetical protein